MHDAHLSHRYLTKPLLFTLYDRAGVHFWPGFCACAKPSGETGSGERHAIYCVAVKHSPGVGAASPDGQASENVRKNEPLNSRKNMLSVWCRIRHHTGYKSVKQSGYLDEYHVVGSDTARRYTGMWIRHQCRIM